MRRMLAKIRFIHKRLWMRDATYRVAFLVGPPPLIGIVVATLVWLGVQASRQPVSEATGSNLIWAQYTPPVAPEASGPPAAVTPDAAMPATGATGVPVGLTTGWQGVIVPITINAALDVDVLTTPLATFLIDEVAIDQDRILAAGPQGGLFVGEANAFLAVKTEGPLRVVAPYRAHVG
jgi:hypothetical protein